MADEGTVPWLTYPRALAEVEEMIAAASDHEAVLLSGHRDFLRQRSEWARALLV
jgi:hypothetical protein